MGMTEFPVQIVLTSIVILAVLGLGLLLYELPKRTEMK